MGIDHNEENGSISPIKSPVEWLTENEKLRDELDCCRSQLHVYETEIVELNHKLETLGIELEMRPSHNSLQVCNIKYFFP